MGRSSYLKLSFRKPPKPISWNIEKGNCRFCGGPILKLDGTKNTRRHWHPMCVVEWAIMNRPRDARAYVWEHFKGTCQHCMKASWAYGETWEVDHKEPLFLAAGNLSYWAKENLQLLCSACHKIKSKADMQVFREVADLRNFKHLP